VRVRVAFLALSPCGPVFRLCCSFFSPDWLVATVDEDLSLYLHLVVFRSLVVCGGFCSCVAVFLPRVVLFPRQSGCGIVLRQCSVLRSVF
jgi:hypothetical protein